MKNIFIKYILPIFTSILIGYFLYASLIQTDFVKKEIKLELTLDSYQSSEIQFFLEDDKQFKVANMRSQKIDLPKNNYRIDFEIPLVYNPGRIRIDPGFTRGKWLLKKLTFKGLNGEISYNAEEIYNKFEPINDIKQFKFIPNEGVLIESNGQDPYIISKFSSYTFFDFLSKKPVIYFFPFLISLCISLFAFYLVRVKLVDYLNSTQLTVEHYLVSIFIVLLFLPLILMTFYPSSSTSGENRELQKKPVFTFDRIINYPKEYNGYFQDNFGFKKQLSTLNSYYKFKLFNTSSKPEIVAIGKNGWLFSTDPNIVGDYQNRKLYNDEELKTIKYNLEEAYNWYAERGIHFFIMVMPLKSNIYPEYLPNSIKRLRENSKLIQLRDYLAANSSVKIIDITEELIKTKPDNEVYYPHDIHMNFNGGYIAYQKLMNEMGKFNLDLNPLPIGNYKKVEKHMHNADLSRLLSLEDILLNDEMQMKKKNEYNYLQVDAPTYETVSIAQPTVRTQIKNSKFPKVVVYRDSFFNLIMPYFSENFSDCIYIWSKEMSVEVIDKETPGYVVYETLESGLDKFLEDNPTRFRKK